MIPPCAAGLAVLSLSAAPTSIDYAVRPELPGGIALHEMCQEYLLRLSDERWRAWQEAYAERKEPASIHAHHAELRRRFVEALGGWPQRCPLAPQLTGVIQCDGYRVEKVLFASLPDFHVSGAVFVPESPRFEPPYPAVLIPCGHSQTGKAHDTYQTMAALLALEGFVALVYDPIDQGERRQLPAEGPGYWGTRAHTNLGVGCILLGENTARYEIWDGMRGIDYLQSRDDVDHWRIGCCGNSGGGTQTAYLMSLDDRIGAAAPSCYIHGHGMQLRHMVGGRMGDAEQNIFGQLAWGMDHADYLTMQAPLPVLMIVATDDFFSREAAWTSFQFAKRLYARLGASERMDIIENDAPHNYNRASREATVRWMARWLQGRDEPIAEPDIELIPVEALYAAPDGQITNLPGERTAYDLNRDTAARLAATRPAVPPIDRVRVLAGIRPLAELPEPRVEPIGPGRLVLWPEEGIALPAVHLEPATPTGPPVLLVASEGKAAAAERIEALAAAGRRVLAVDLRGTGETAQTAQTALGGDFGTDWEDQFTVYLLGRSYVGMRAEDILVCARWLREPVELIAVGAVGVPALHAAACEPGLFAAVQIEGSLASWQSIVDGGRNIGQLESIVHAALREYDLPGLERLLGDKLTVIDRRDEQGAPLE